MASAAALLQPGIEIAGEAKGVAYPAAYSSFAISVDSREAEKNTVNGLGTPSILKHGKSRSFCTPEDKYYSSYGKSKGSPPLGSSKHGVRFSISERNWRDGPSGRHGRKSSTAAFIDYIQQHLPGQQHRPPMALTPKRAFLLFCIVFSATYLATALVPLLTGRSAYPSEIVVMKRGAGYYGNSHIFRGGDDLTDPHAAGDEHHQYVQHTQGGGTRAQKADASAARMPLERVAAVEDLHAIPARKLKSATLAEQAQLEELRSAQQVLLQQEKALPVFKHVEHPPLPAVDLPFTEAADIQRKAVTIPIPNKKAAMPFKKLADRAKKEVARAEEAMAELVDKVASADDASSADLPARAEAAKETSQTDEEEADVDLEAKIAMLRKEAAARRLARKAGGVEGSKPRLPSAAQVVVVKGDVKPLDGVEIRPKRVERVGAKLGLVAKKLAKVDNTAKELEAAAVMLD